VENRPDKRGYDQARRLSRRGLLRLTVAGAAALAAGPALAAKPERRLTLRNLHTNEMVAVVYWSNGRYQPSALGKIYDLLRDHRRDEVHPIDPRLLDLLHRLRLATSARAPFEIISGYRSPQTNAVLRAGSSGVAKRSYHMRGEAVDIRLPCCGLDHLHRQALKLRGGGVGLYRRSQFVHVDVGPVRQWIG